MAIWKEKKIKQRLWKFRYQRISKKRPPKRRRRVYADQYAIKTDKDTYRLIMRGKYK